MSLATFEEIVKMQSKGLLTIPKKIRENLGLKENGFIRLKVTKGSLLLEPVCTLPYPVRSYTDEELAEFIELDRQESKELRKKGLL